VVVSRLAAALLLLVLAGCSRGDTAPPQVRVQVGSQDLALRPTQYCLDGTGRRYQTTPPILEVSPGSPITLTVPGDVAERGWSVQVFDEKLQQPLGDVRVPKGEAVFRKLSTSDVVPPAFYLVIVEDKGGPCGEFSGAWPVGFLRAGGHVGGSPTGSPSSTPAA
jgi:Protein of unknown function (DUF2771)